jgi:hypothetical protein
MKKKVDEQRLLVRKSHQILFTISIFFRLKKLNQTQQQLKQQQQRRQFQIKSYEFEFYILYEYIFF